MCSTRRRDLDQSDLHVAEVELPLKCDLSRGYVFELLLMEVRLSGESVARFVRLYVSAEFAVSPSVG